MDMDTAIGTMRRRRSVRAFLPEQISREALRTLLECALYAPTGGNLQHSRFLVIQDPERLEALNRALCEELAARPLVEGQYRNKGILAARREGFHFFYHAPTVITAVAPRDAENAMADCAVGLEHIQLAATALGLGACWANQPHWLTDVPGVRAIFMPLGLRPEEDIFGSVSVGRPARPMKPAGPRKEGRAVVDVDLELPL